MKTTSPTTQKLRVRLRCMTDLDLPEVLAIEADNFEFPWLEDDFVFAITQCGCIGRVAKHEDRVVGFLVYAMFESRIELGNIAVAADFVRKGVGTQLVSELIGKLSALGRTRITLGVSENDLPAQLFFRSLGFRAVSVLHGWWHDVPDDAYRMEYRMAGW